MELVAHIAISRPEIEDESFPEDVALESEYKLYAHVSESEEPIHPASPVMVPVKRIVYEVHELVLGEAYVAVFEDLSLPALSEAFEELAEPALRHFLSV